MTNNLGDFEHEQEPGSGGLSPPEGGGTRANLMHAWRTRPLFKLMVLMIVVGAVIAVTFTLFSSPPPGPVSKLAPPPPSLHQPPGGPASPYFVEQTLKAETDRENAAIKSGGSALPTPIGQNISIDEMTAEKQKKDPLVELRAQIEQQKQKIAQIEQQKQQPTKPEQFDDSLAQAMQKQMTQLMKDWEPKGIKLITTKAEAEDEKEKDDAQKKAQEASNSTTNTATSTPSQAQTKIIVSAGTVSYAQLLTEANSDVPGPILAQIMSGPLSGARAVGQFKTMDEYLVLTFSLADLKGKDYSIDALALDPDTTLGAMATEVDERWMSRVLLPAAAGFIEGFGQALGQNSSSLATNGTTTIVQESGRGLQQGIFTGIGQAGQTMGQFFQNQADQTKPLIRVAAGSPMGLFFVNSVIDNSDYPQQQQPYPYGPGRPAGYPSGYGYNPMNQGGYGYNASLPGSYYPGGAMPGYGGYSSYNGQIPNGSTSPAASAPYPGANMPYNPALNSNPGGTPFGNSGMLSNNNGMLNMPNTSGIGTTVINP